jgi:alkaline phosphatase D
VLAAARPSARASADETMQVAVRGLRPGTRFFYRFVGTGGRRSDTGQFATAPAANQNATIRFGWSGDADAQSAVGATAPYFGSFAAFGSMARQHNVFNINLGDTIYSDSEVPNQGTPALTLQAKWAKYKQNLSMRNLQRVREAAGMYNEWDDHEFINDFSKAENGNALYQVGAKAFRNYMPTGFRSSSGLYRTFRWGKNLQLFFLDERSFRDAKASAGHVCDNPSTGKPDNAPTAPQSTRATFALVAPEFSQPVSAQCLATINDPNRTFLGRSQLARFERDIKRSKATWKVIVNEVPIQQFYGLPYDRWEGYAAERTKLLTFLHNNVKNVVFATTDVHANLVNDVRFQTLEPGGPKNSGIMEFTTGPVATGTFSKEIDNTLGKSGDGKVITQFFFHPQPPAGVGMKCANTDIFSFGEATATAKTFTVRLLDQNGRPFKDVSGGACGPFRLKAKK